MAARLRQEKLILDVIRCLDGVPAVGRALRQRRKIKWEEKKTQHLLSRFFLLSSPAGEEEKNDK